MEMMEMEPEKPSALKGEEDIFAALDNAHGAETSEEEASDGGFLPKNSLIKFPGAKIKVVSSRGTLQWFRLQCPGWGIVTEKVQETDKFIEFRATVYDADERIRSTGSKTWSKTKPGTGQFALECAETGAINRALNNLGFLGLVAKTGFDPDGKEPYWKNWKKEKDENDSK